jgi:hypothetical protein
MGKAGGGARQHATVTDKVLRETLSVRTYSICAKIFKLLAALANLMATSKCIAGTS